MSQPNKKAKIHAQRIEASSAPIPPALGNITLARFIDLDSFVQARQFELNHFLGILDDKANLVGKTKQAFQMLPKHMRRRAMSHNTYRVPARVRNRQESLAQVKRSTRKRRRRTSQLLADYSRRDKQHTWLETHIWHAKRMHMDSRWGYKLAVHPNEKGERACYRFAAHDCTLYDASYFVCLRISGNLPKFAEQYLEKTEVPVQTMEKTAAWDNRLWNKESKRLVAPVTLFFISQESFVLVVHPAAYQEAKMMITEKYAVEDLKDQLVYYRLRGPRSLDVIKASIKFREEHINQLLTSAASFTAYQFPRNALIGFSYKQHKVQGPMRTLPTDKEDVNFADGFIPSSMPHTLLSALLNWPQELSVTGLWDVIKERQVTSLVPSKLTTRSRRCRFPKPEVKTVAVEEGKEPLEEVPEPEESSESEADEPVARQSTYLPALLIFRQSSMKRGLGSGWDLLAPAGHGTALWRQLVYSGGKVTGLREQESLALEQGELTFPNDYPTTQAYDLFLSEQGEARKQKFDRTPSAHKVNPERIGFPYPYQPSWSSLTGVPSTQASNVLWEDLIPLRIKALRRKPVPNSLLCLPLPSDLEESDGPAHQESLHTRSIASRSATSRDMETACKVLPLDREVVGFVTSGGFSLVRGKGYGVGYVLRQKWNEDTMLLFRCPQSRFYHLANVAPL